jgi:hypothetical protein
MELAVDCVQALRIVEHGLADRLADGPLKLGAVFGRKLLEDGFRAEHGGLVQQTLVTHGRTLNPSLEKGKWLPVY